MTPHTWEIALWAERRLECATTATIHIPVGPTRSAWDKEVTLYAEILALSIYADEDPPGLVSNGWKYIDPHALLDWLRAKKAKKEGDA